MSQRISQARLSSDSFDPRLTTFNLKTPSGAFGFYVTGKRLSFSWLLVRLYHFKGQNVEKVLVCLFCSIKI